jgi:methyl-accepting chemotaxis protein
MPSSSRFNIKERFSEVLPRLTRPLKFVSIRTKILILPVVALAALLISSLFTFSISRTNTSVLDQFSTRTLPVMTLISAVNTGLVEVQSLYTQALGDKDEFELEDARKRADEVRGSLAAITTKDASYEARVTELLSSWDRYVDRSDAAVKGQIGGKSDMQTLQQQASDKQKAYENIHSALQKLSEDSEANFVGELNRASASASRASRMAWVLLFIVACLLMFVSLLVDTAVSQPIEKLKATIGEVAQGNFGVQVEVEGRDAVALMCQAFGSLLSDLNAAIAETNTVLAAVARGDFSRRVTAELPGDLATLKRGVNESANSVQRTMDALDAVMDALAAGNFSARMRADVEGESRRKVDKAMTLLQQSLQALGATMSAAAEGDFSRRIETELPGDLGVLKRAVNQSLDGLAAAFAEISETTHALSEGDLTRRATGNFSGSLGKLTEALNSSLDHLSSVIRSVAETADEVSAGVEEIARGNADLSARTERQAASLEESASSIEELLSSARATAENSRQTSEITHNASEDSRQGAEVVLRAGKSMSAIIAASKSISEIIGLIDSIAFQTNLLALNAAVEAARAGEHGRGFAVVASEVRGLAQRTAASAKEIRNLIAVSSERVGEGNALVEESGRKLEAIARSSEHIAQLVRDAAQAVQEQTSGLQQISKAINELESVNQQNGTLVTEVAASSNSLTERAAQLREAVASFRFSAVADDDESQEADDGGPFEACVA